MGQYPCSPSIKPDSPRLRTIRIRQGAVFLLKGPEEQGIVWMAWSIHGNVTGEATTTKRERDVWKSLGHFEV